MEQDHEWRVDNNFKGRGRVAYFEA